MTTDLPPGWAAAELGDLVNTKSGNSKLIKGKLSSAAEPGLVPAYSASGQDVWCDRAEWEVDGVVLSAVGARCGKTFLARGRWTAIANTHVLVPAPGIDTRWLWYLTNNEDFWVKGGSAQPFVKMKLSKRIPVSVPPLAEQKRIVAAIAEHFSRVDGVDVNLGSVASRVEILEQALINQAMKGERQRLGDHLAEPLRNGFSPPRSSDGNTRVLTLTAVTEREFIEENTKLAVVPQLKRDRLTLRPGDILVQRSNTPELVGTAALYSGPSGWAVFPDLLIRVRPDHTLFPAYLELALRSSEVRRYFRLSAQGIAGSMPKISQSTIEELEIRIPETIAEQQSIVRRISIELQAVKEVQDCVSSACKRADLLRRVILAAAFAGQLVPQNPGR